MKLHGVHSIVVNSANLLGGDAITHVLRGLYMVVLARFLGPEIYGVFAYGHHWYLAFLPLAGAGAISNLLGREVPRQSEFPDKLVSRAFSLQTLLSAAAAIVCAIVGWLANDDATIRDLLLILSLALAARALAGWADGMFIAYERARYVLYQNLMFRPAEVLIGIALLAMGEGIITLAALHALVWIAQATWALYIVRRRLVKFPWRPFSLPEGVMQLASLYWLVLLSGWIQQGPVVLFRHAVEDQGQLGQFALAMQLYILACAVPQAVVRASLPALSRSVGRRDEKEKLFMNAMIHLAIFAGAVGGMTGTAIGPWLIPAVFGMDFTQTGKLLGPVLCLLTPLTVYVAGTKVFIAHGFYKNALVVSVIGGIILMLFVPLFTGFLGVSGAIAGVASALCIADVFLIVMLKQKLRYRTDATAVRSIVIAITASLAFFAISSFFSNLIALAVALSILGTGYIPIYKNLRNHSEIFR